MQKIIFLKKINLYRLLKLMLLNVWVAVQCVNGFTLKQSLESAYNTNPELQERQEFVKAEHEKIAQALAGWRPTITASGGIAGAKSKVKDDRRNQPSRTNETSGISKEAKIELRQNLFAGGAVIAGVEKAECEIKTSWYGLHSLEQNILLATIKAYLDLTAKYNKLALHQSNKKALEQYLENAQEKFRIGEETSTQLANAQSKFAESQALLTSAEAELFSSQLEYTRITGLDSEYSAHQKLDTDMSYAIQPEKDYQTTALNTVNPEILAAKFNYLSADKEVKIATSRFAPIVDVTGSSTLAPARSETINDTIGTIDAGRTYKTDNQILLSANWKLYQGGATSSQRRQALQIVAQRKRALDAVKRKITAQASASLQNFLSYKANIETYKAQIKAAELTLKSTQEEVKVGTKVLLDDLNAQRELLQAKLNLVDAIKNYCVESYLLLSFIGKLTARNLKLNVDYFNPQMHYQKIRAHL